MWVQENMADPATIKATLPRSETNHRAGGEGRPRRRDGLQDALLVLTRSIHLSGTEVPHPLTQEVKGEWGRIRNGTQHQALTKNTNKASEYL